jgi:murein L,D-transpeptidase YcbB/YkuD
VEKPVELADYVLAGQDGWDEVKVRNAMMTAHSAGEDKVANPDAVTLKQPLAVYLVYLTAFVRNGSVIFLRDPYGKDREAIAKLGKLRPSDPSLCEELQKLIGG